MEVPGLFYEWPRYVKALGCSGHCYSQELLSASPGLSHPPPPPHTDKNFRVSGPLSDAQPGTGGRGQGKLRALGTTPLNTKYLGDEFKRERADLPPNRVEGIFPGHSGASGAGRGLGWRAGHWPPPPPERFPHHLI